MFRRKPSTDEMARTIENLVAQVGVLWDQQRAATVEFERRYDEMKRDRDYWREQAEGGKL